MMIFLGRGFSLTPFARRAVLLSVILGAAFWVALAQAAEIKGDKKSGDPAGKILLVRGQVFILNGQSRVVADPAGKRGRSTQVDQNFYVGETVQTKNDGRIKLLFREGKNEVVLGADTSLLIEKASTQAGAPAGTTLSLVRGELRSRVQQKYSGEGEDRYEVKTQNAVAGVRGTVFTVHFDARTLQSQISTQRGAVEVRSRAAGDQGPRVWVKPGMFVSAGAAGGSAAGATELSAPAPLSSNPTLQKQVENLGQDSAGGGSPDPAVGNDAANAAPPPLGREYGSREPASREDPAANANNGDGGFDRAREAVSRRQDEAAQVNATKTQQGAQRAKVIFKVK